MGDMGDLVWVRFLFLQTSGDRIFFPDIQRCSVRFFARIISHERYFFQWSKFFPPVISLQKIFLTRNQSAGIFFSEITHSPLPPQKSNDRPLSLDRLNWPEFCWVKNRLTIVDDNSNLCSVVVRSLYDPIGLSLAKPVTLFSLFCSR